MMVNSNKYIHYLDGVHCLELFQTMFLKLFVTISRYKGGNVPTHLGLLEIASLSTADSEILFEKAQDNGHCPKE
jgi:hypothetical protein